MPIHLDKKQGNNWYFAEYESINFNTGKPVNNKGSVMYSPEGCSSISGSQGNLLFYTDDNIVYNSHDSVMNKGLGGHNSSSQSAIIVPVISDNNKYYIFTTDES